MSHTISKPSPLTVAHTSRFNDTYYPVLEVRPPYPTDVWLGPHLISIWRPESGTYLQLCPNNALLHRPTRARRNVIALTAGHAFARGERKFWYEG